MGFCRRCGDICQVRCNKCGGAATAPTVQFGQKSEATDSWSKTYAPESSFEKTHTRRPLSAQLTNNFTDTTSSSNNRSTSSSPTKRFPRPVSFHSTGSGLGSSVSAHIANTTSQLNNNRPPSPLKHSTVPAPEADILPSPYTSSLAKVYGSVLQPKETLEMHSCAICSTPFPPDATIYPDLLSDPSEHRFLCRPCFTENGGSKGDCPTCSKPVLALKNEGGFVQASGSFWHKKCYNCSGCHKNIGDNPMVDLMGRPSCAECFETCLRRDPSTPKKKAEPIDTSPALDRLGGMSAGYRPGKGRESSPAIEELEQRLGIRSREASPALEELDKRLRRFSNLEERSPLSGRRSRAQSIRADSPTPSDDTGRYSPIKRQSTGVSVTSRRMSVASGSASPVRSSMTGTQSPAPTEEAIEEMKRRFLKSATSSPASTTIELDYTPSPRRTRYSRSSSSLKDSASEISSTSSRTATSERYRSPSPSSASVTTTTTEGPYPPSTPDLLSDFSDTTTQSSVPDSPPRAGRESAAFENAKIHGRGYGSKYTKGLYIDDEPLSTPAAKTRNRSMSTPYATLSKDARSIPQTPKTSSSELPSSSACAKCGGGLFTIGEAGKFVTVPSDNGDAAKTYHVDCFRCVMCEGTFRSTSKGQAIFVRGEGGPCHVECTKPERVVVKATTTKTSVAPPMVFPSKSTSAVPAKTSYSSGTPKSPAVHSSRLDRPVSATPSPTNAFPRWGSSSSCPGCQKSVSPMERGVVPGPQGTRWHATCLVCGGKKPTPKWGIRETRKKDEPGCGKKLDSAAKSDGDGGVWCRECLLLLSSSMREDSPTRLSSSRTGDSVATIRPQNTGGTTIAQQVTGSGFNDTALYRQLTGGGLSPTRQLDRSTSPIKQNGVTRPRPKSALGIRGGKSVDERMFISRQTTGSSNSSKWRY